MSENEESGRVPVIAVELELDKCSLTNGTAPCTANPATGFECFNTRATCQDLANYDKTTGIVRLTDSHRAQVTISAIPCVEALRESPAKIVPGSVGIRETVSITCRDFPHNDYGVDPYKSTRTVNAFDTGSFFPKLKARNPYYVNRPLRVFDGYESQALASYTGHHFVLSTIEGPDSNNRVRIVGKDVLALAQDNKANVPAVTTSSLSASITDSATSLTITGGTIADYADYSYLRIDDEVLGFTYNVSGTFTGLTRGQAGTTAAAHDADAEVQAVWQFSGHPVDALSEILGFTGVSASFIPTTDWNTEKTGPLDGYTVSTFVTEPTGATQLLNELLLENGINMWWDNEAQEVKIRAVSQFIPSDYAINDSEHIIADSFSVRDDNAKRLSRVIFYYAPKDYSQDLSKSDNFSRVHLVADAAKESTDEYGDSPARKIYSRWYQSAGSAYVVLASQRILDLYREMPRSVKFSLDAKDSNITVGSLVDVTHDKLQDAYGNPQVTRVLVLSRDSKDRGHTYNYDCMVVPDAVDAANTVTLPTRNFNAWEFLGQPAAVDDYEITIPDGVILYSDSAALPGVTTGAFTAGSTCKFIIGSSHCVGGGGKGGTGGDGTSYYDFEFNQWFASGSQSGSAGSPGGTAIEFLCDGSIETTNGNIWAGGGGGGGSNGIVITTGPTASDGEVYGGSGGGSGASGSFLAGGAGGLAELANGSGTERQGATGGAGGLNSGGMGAPLNTPVGASADGGDHGESGSAVIGGGAAGAAGVAIEKNGFTVTFTGSSKATLEGTGQIKGAVT